MSDLDLSFGFPTRARVVRPSLYTVYLTVIATGVLGSMAWRTVSSVVGPALDTRLAPAFALAWTLSVSGAVLAAARRAGPAGVSRAALTWCLGSPVVTAMLLRRALLGRVLLAGTAGTLTGLVAALVQRAAPGWVAAGAGGGAVLGAALAGLAAVDQARGRRWAVRCGGVLIALGMTAWYAAAFDLARVVPAVLPGLAAAAAVLVLAGLAVTGRRVRRAVRGGRYQVHELVRAGEVAERVGAAAAMLAASPLRRAARQRRALRMPRGARGGPALWVARTDLRRILARPGTLLVLVALVPLPGSVARAGHEGLAGMVLVLLGHAVLGRLALWWRAWEDSTALPFLLPLEDRTAVLALLAAPLLVLLVLAVAAAAVAGLPAGWVTSTVTGALLSTRWKLLSDRIPGEVLVSTDAGAVPVVQTLRTVAGWDVALVVGGISLLLW
jgi:hypothetical protein